MEYIYTDKDGNQTKFTDEMVKAALDERNELRERVERAESARDRHWIALVEMRSKITEFFSEDYNIGDVDLGPWAVSDINEFLESIGADTLKRLWTVTLRVDVTISDIEAASADEASDIAVDELEVTHSSYLVESYDSDVRNVEEQ